jgi:hypothetical protein
MAILIGIGIGRRERKQERERMELSAHQQRMAEMVAYAKARETDSMLKIVSSVMTSTTRR